MSNVKVEDNSEKILAEFREAVLRGLTRCGDAAEGYAKDLSPIDTGLLRNSITFALSGEPPKISSYKADKGVKTGSYSGTAPDDGQISVYLGTNVEYAENVELGTSKMDAQPFLKPAVADHAQTYKNIMMGELKNG